MPTTVVALAQADAAYAARRAAHRAHLLLGEADGAAVARAEEDVARALGDADAHELVAVVDGERDDARGADVRERVERGLLDHALPRRHDDEGALGELAHGSIATTRSPSWSGTRLTSALPFAVRARLGSSYTFLV